MKSVGFPKTYQLSLINDSLNYVEIFLKMEENGTDPLIDYNQILESFKTENFKFDPDPAEFVLEPTRFTLRPKGMQNITVKAINRNYLCTIYVHMYYIFTLGYG